MTVVMLNIFRLQFAEFDEIMHSDPDSLKNIISKVLTWLVRTRWRRAIWGTLSVIKCKFDSMFKFSIQLKYLVSDSEGPFTQPIFVAQLNAIFISYQCNFCRAELATSCDFIANLVQFVSSKRQCTSVSIFVNKSCAHTQK